MEASIKKRKFRHVILEGDNYAIGRKQAHHLAADPEYLKWFTSPHVMKGKMSEEDYFEAVKCFERYCPGINAEIEGMADVLKTHPREIIYYAFTHTPKGNCSHFALHPSITENGHTMVGRSYEWNDNEDDFRLCTTRVKGKAAHIGFSCIMLGRMDGINEHGLCVTMSNGSPMREAACEGVKFWAVIRSILENCKTAEEGAEMAMNTPVSFFLNLIIADKSGKAVLVETACDKKELLWINADAGRKFIHSTNHFTLEGLVNETEKRMSHSKLRYDFIRKRLNSALPEVSYDEIKKILSDKMPEGLTCHYYSETLGTLWSMIFDLDEFRADICFGSPQLNKWRSFDFKSGGIDNYFSVGFLDETAAPSIWEHVEI